MNKRQQLLQSLAHKSGPVPIDFGGTPVSGMHCSCVAQLRAKLGLEPRPDPFGKIYRCSRKPDTIN
jgi:hypothetical protein